jgi:hypothetical protein
MEPSGEVPLIEQKRWKWQHVMQKPFNERHPMGSFRKDVLRWPGSFHVLNGTQVPTVFLWKSQKLN